MAGTARALGRAAWRLSQRQYHGMPQMVQSYIAINCPQHHHRCFSSSPLSYLPKDVNQTQNYKVQESHLLPEYSHDILTETEKHRYEMMTSEERAAFDAENQRLVEMWNDPTFQRENMDLIEKAVQQVDKGSKLRFEDIRERNRGFWAEEEEDEFANAEDGDDTYNDDEITSMAHAELDMHREIREYARIAAWDMPLLSNLSKPFELPKPNQILRFRYTSYLGEQHPAEHKVVVELSSKDLVPNHLNEQQRQTFLKLVGPRYNPDTDIVRMSCEKFSARAQNKRYLGDTIKSLIKEAKEGDSFADVPLDLRHHKPKVRHTFPESWKMTDDKQHQLSAKRQLRLQTEQERNTIVDGKEAVLHAIRTLPALSQNSQLRAAEERSTSREPTGRGKTSTRQRR